MEKKYYIVIILTALITAVIAHFGSAYNPDEFQDTDGDGLTDHQEKAIYQTYWYDKDTDNDGIDDGVEVSQGNSPKQQNKTMLEADTDNDGLNDQWEILLGTNLMIRDTDQDGYIDGTEVYHGYSPTDPAPVKVEKLIKVNIADFLLSYSFDGIILDKFLVSTGKPSTPTPVGEFSIIAKAPIKHYYGLPNTKWNLHFTTNKNGLRYYIHGAYWHVLFGKENVSGGCVNIRYENMENLYNWANIGTKVIIE